MQKRTNEESTGFILRESSFRGQQYVAVLRRKIKSSEGSVTRYDQPRISGTVRLAVPITFLSLSSFLFPSFSFFRSIIFFPSQRLLLLRCDSPSRLYQVRSEQPDRRSLTSSSAGCNKKKPPTARSATRYTDAMRTRVSDILVRACVCTRVSSRLLLRPGTTLRTSNEIKFKYNQIKFKI